jgi:hypothetical protein
MWMPIDGAQFVVSMLGGGLAGGCVNVFFTRLFHRRSLRIKFYPTLTFMFSAYRIRLADNPDDRWLIVTVNEPPLPPDDNFVRHRSDFTSKLIEFTELKEVRLLREQLARNAEAAGTGPKGTLIKVDLKPESDALWGCVKTIKRKLRLS